MNASRDYPELLAMLKTYKPTHADNWMRSHGDVMNARADYASRKSDNLRRLVRSRFEWMNQYIAPDSCGVDVGCGAGFSRDFIRCRKLLLTDFAEHDYLDIQLVDALNLPFGNGSFNLSR